MKHFKKVSIAALAIIIAVGVACTEDNAPSASKEDFDPAQIASILEAQAQFDDAFMVSDAAISSSSGRTAATDLCASISLDTASRNLVIDFGDGCTGPHGVERSGKMIINYLSFSLAEGISYGLSFEDFAVNGNTLNGAIDVSGFRRNDDKELFFQVEISDGRIDLADGRNLTHSSIRTFTWTAGEGNDDEGDNEFEFTGSAEGKTLDDVSYSINFSSPLVLKEECFDEGLAFASAGVLEVSLSTLEDVVTVDFGDGACDAVADWTYLDRSGTLNLRN